MTGMNPWSEADSFDLDDRYEVISGLPGDDGRVVVVAGAVMEKQPEWLQLVGFVVGDGRMDLVAQTIMRTPTDWDDPVGDRVPILMRLGEQVVMPSESKSYLTTAIVRSAATAGLEMRVRRHMNAREWDGRTTAETWFGGAVDVGPTPKRTGPVSERMMRHAEIARRYVELCEETSTPRPRLMEEFGLANNTIQSYLNLARNEGLLTRPERKGMVGGQLTKLAHEVLRESESSAS